MVYSISYDLNRPGQDYPDLIAAIKSFDAWARPCKSYWLVATHLNAEAIFKLLQPFMDKNDSILVTRVDLSDRSGWLTQTIWDWIKQHAGYQPLSANY